jgi:hypothetical protein
MRASLAQEWQQINGVWHFCHWWQDQGGGTVTAMVTFAVILLVIAAGMGLLVIPHDGYGTRPGPRSHLDPFEPRDHVI